MQRAASWLVARPQNAVLGLAATLLMPLVAPIVSGATIAMLILYQGALRTAFHAAIAIGLLMVFMLVVGEGIPNVIGSAVVTWLPAVALALLMRRCRSITLTLQLSAIFAVLVIAAIYVVLGDPTVYWNNTLDLFIAIYTNAELTGLADSIRQLKNNNVAVHLTFAFVFVSWLVSVLALILGYALFRALPDRDATLGRFCDLSFGQILALASALVVAASLLLDSPWLHDTALYLGGAFCLQGLAIVHWLHASGRFPIAVVIGVYVLLPLLNLVLIAGLAVVGYFDVWFKYRRRISVKDAN